MIGLKIKEEIIIHTDEYYYTVIRRNIRKLRKEKNLTQQDLADLTNISREYICDVENESRNKHITIAYLGRIADALGVEISDLFKTNKK
ncbi:MAG: helix-turn-helix transcriptional regulator [Erysipelotrichales bacterium]|nr:helix-turn-helix transcriptional regulator [Erysipelotrichales bacterium]